MRVTSLHASTSDVYAVGYQWGPRITRPTFPKKVTSASEFSPTKPTVDLLPFPPGPYRYRMDMLCVDLALPEFSLGGKIRYDRTNKVVLQIIKTDFLLLFIGRKNYFIF